MSKLTGTGIKALRHYEKINILKPAYVDPQTGYRYYRFNQAYILELIRFAVELDIPLKELTKYVDEKGNLDFEAFVARGNKVVREKMKTLEQALRLFDYFDEKMALQKEYSLKQIYTRRLPSKIFYTIPYKKSFSEADSYEISKLFLDMPHDEEYESEVGWVEYGFLAEHTPRGVKRYVYVEAAQNGLFENPAFQRKIIPAGKYSCRQDDKNQIEKAPDIFKDYIAGRDNFIVIETEIYFCNFNINNPVNELRVLAW
ncbi:MAG: MerR family transcriptional regulator [Defluviitaleaceae bacterium]|nr:MerR family transcriptional regulator [Defluviitaleaceae bacterium]